jgi:hypothetical protein
MYKPLTYIKSTNQLNQQHKNVTPQYCGMTPYWKMMKIDHGQNPTPQGSG